jgi:predicted RecA/RadA family phage recombinase
MTTTYKQPGEVIDYVAAANVASGEPVRIGLASMGIAAGAIASGAAGSVLRTGVHALAKNTSDALVQGGHVWWDADNEECINAPVTGSLYLGTAFAAAGASAATCEVLLGTFGDERGRVLTLAATGAQSLAVADFLTGGDLIVLAPNTAALTLTLPSVADVPIGARFTLRKTTADAHAVTLDGAGSETVGGGATFATIDANNDHATFVNTGAAWALVDSAIA